MATPFLIQMMELSPETVLNIINNIKKIINKIFEKPLKLNLTVVVFFKEKLLTMAFYFLYFLTSDSLPLLIFLFLFTDYE